MWGSLEHRLSKCSTNRNSTLLKGQLSNFEKKIQAEDSPKKRTNEFVFTSMRRVFVRFLGESSARKKTFRDYLTFTNFDVDYMLKLVDDVFSVL